MAKKKSLSRSRLDRLFRDVSPECREKLFRSCYQILGAAMTEAAAEGPVSKTVIVRNTLQSMESVSKLEILALEHKERSVRLAMALKESKLKAETKDSGVTIVVQEAQDPALSQPGEANGPGDESPGQ